MEKKWVFFLIHWVLAALGTYWWLPLVQNCHKKFAAFWGNSEELKLGKMPFLFLLLLLCDNDTKVGKATLILVFLRWGISSRFEQWKGKAITTKSNEIPSLGIKINAHSRNSLYTWWNNFWFWGKTQVGNKDRTLCFPVLVSA